MLGSCKAAKKIGPSTNSTSYIPSCSNEHQMHQIIEQIIFAYNQTMLNGSLFLDPSPRTNFASIRPSPRRHNLASHMTSEAVSAQPPTHAWNTISCLALAYAGDRQIPEAEAQRMISEIAKHTSAYVFLQGPAADVPVCSATLDLLGDLYNAAAFRQTQLLIVPLLPSCGWDAAAVASIPTLTTIIESSTPPTQSQQQQRADTQHHSSGADATPDIINAKDSLDGCSRHDSDSAEKSRPARPPGKHFTISEIIQLRPSDLPPLQQQKCCPTPSRSVAPAAAAPAAAAPAAAAPAAAAPAAPLASLSAAAAPAAAAATCFTSPPVHILNQPPAHASPTPISHPITVSNIRLLEAPSCNQEPEASSGETNAGEDFSRPHDPHCNTTTRVLRPASLPPHDTTSRDESQRQLHSGAAQALVEASVEERWCPLSFSRVALGGTFDRLHSGHLLLLAAAAAVTRDQVYIGITADNLLVNKTHRELLQSYEQRSAVAEAVVSAVRPGLTVITGPLSDPKAPTQAELDPAMEALVVSAETMAGAQAINSGRAARGFAPLTLVVVPVIGVSRDGSKLSSSGLRQREADRQLAS